MAVTVELDADRGFQPPPPDLVGEKQQQCIMPSVLFFLLSRS